jgi:hypothetical protein
MKTDTVMVNFLFMVFMLSLYIHHYHCWSNEGERKKKREVVPVVPFPSCSRDKDSNKRFIIELAQPLYEFHSHSWFHMAEYYLSSISPKMINQIPDDGVLAVIAWSDKFVKMANHMSLFILLISLTHGKLRRLELFPRENFEMTPMSLINSHSDVIDNNTDTGSHNRDKNRSRSRYILRKTIYEYKNNRNGYIYVYDSTKPAPSQYYNQIILPHHTICGYDLNNQNQNLSNNEMSKVKLSVGSHAATKGSWFNNSIHKTNFYLKLHNACSKYNFIDDKRKNGVEIKNLNKSLNISYTLHGHVSKSKKMNIMIYQRDNTRRLRNLSKLIKYIKYMCLDRVNTIGLEKKGDGREFSQYHDILRTPCGSDSYTNSSIFSYLSSVHILHHHENNHPCYIYQSFNQADIVITSHGFQV